MSKDRKSAIVICPGRGTYTKNELGYLRTFHRKRGALIDTIDNMRLDAGQTPVSVLDGAESFSLGLYSRGDNAASLIFACSYGDFLSVDRRAYDIVAIAGNSMGWYTALACAEALQLEHAIELVNTMGVLTHEGIVGAQVIHCFVDDNWQAIAGRRQALMEAMTAVNDNNEGRLYLSIDLGGMLLFAGEDRAIDAFLQRAPSGPGRFPMRLQNHGAFHSPLMADVAERAKSRLSSDWFGQPAFPLIDGQGRIWRPRASDPMALWDYTLGAQIVGAYDFTTSIRVAIREFAPDCLIVLGPGDTLGGAVAQCLIGCDWRSLASKSAFAELQKTSPYVLSMGREDQRRMVELQLQNEAQSA